MPFRPERFVLSTEMAAHLTGLRLRVDSIEVDADGSARLVLVGEETDPVCAHCGAPATCFGLYEDPNGEPDYGCDSCCGHGNEDGWCKRVCSGCGAMMAESSDDCAVCLAREPAPPPAESESP